MAILHIVRCDGPDCTVEAPLVTATSRSLHGETSYSVPTGWVRHDREYFHNWGCLSAYATAAQARWDATRQSPYG